jgi:hypothetical protein
MTGMASPRFEHEYPGREIECEHTLSIHFEELTIEACRAGWRVEEVAHAMMRISQDHIWTMVARAAATIASEPHEQKGGQGADDNDGI